MARVNALILAAGVGSRMKSKTPKVLHMLCGRPMIAYALNLAASVGVKQPVVVLGPNQDEVKATLPKEAKVVVQKKAQGTGDAVVAAKRALGSTGDVLVLYADTPLLRRTTVQRLIESHFKGHATCTLLTAHLADPSGYGRVLRNENGLITGVIEEADAHGPQRAIREVNVGPLVCRTQALGQALAAIKPSAASKELYLTEIISQVAQQEGQKIQAVRVEEATEALGVNSRRELARAIGIIRQRIVDTHLGNGVTIEDAQTTFIDHGVTIGQDTLIRPYTVIESGVSIGKRCTVGPFARLRSGVTLADDVRVGNFVELVRSKVGEGVRVNHVTYLGDTTVEAEANIGAGTITANYDGESKRATHIGRGAFIGSDTVLIAPVRVGARAVTGAGSVIPSEHDVPDRAVVAGVPARLLDHRKAKEAASPQPDGKAKPTAAAAKGKAARAGAGKTPKTRRGALKRNRVKGKAKRAARRRVRRAAMRTRTPKARRTRAPKRRIAPRTRRRTARRTSRPVRARTRPGRSRLARLLGLGRGRRKRRGRTGRR